MYNVIDIMYLNKVYLYLYITGVCVRRLGVCVFSMLGRHYLLARMDILLSLVVM